MGVTTNKKRNMHRRGTLWLLPFAHVSTSCLPRYPGFRMSDTITQGETVFRPMGFPRWLLTPSRAEPTLLLWVRTQERDN